MAKHFQIGVIIATAFQRTELLFSRSLQSVLCQTYLPDYIVVVDDNENDNEFEKVAENVAKLNNQNIFCIRNFKTKQNSGTGAWNSGIGFLQSKFEDIEQSYIAILDDDDEWADTYLEKCVNRINDNTKAVFANLVRQHKDFEVQGNVSKENLTVNNFLIGNVGVQGSNMFFNTKALLQIGGFDETLKSCTDRDLMIRFLQHNSVNDIAFVNETLVFHYAQSEDTVTNNHTAKWAGLDSFYNKYLNLFAPDTLEQSLSRTEKLFAYPNRKTIQQSFEKREKIVLAMPMHNSLSTIRRAVLSVVNQKNVRRKLMLVIGNDSSIDNWQEQISDLISDNIITIEIEDGGKSYKVRNEINSYILSNLKNVAYISRLDADDELANDFVISQLEQIIDTQKPDVILAGNCQRKDSEIVGTNRPTNDLLNNNYLMERLRKMSLGDFKAELPSCNTFVKPEYLIDYPPQESAEDHWFLAELLLKTDKYKIYIAKDFILSIYSISGNLTNSNRAENKYLSSRKELFRHIKSKVRVNQASNILQTYKQSNYRYLGEGQEGVVYTDEQRVYKVLDSVSENKLLLLKANLTLLKNAGHLYEIESIVRFQNTNIMIYPYENSEPITVLCENDFVGFLAEMWQRKLIAKNIKPENFVRVSGVIKLIDYELELYTDNLFLNMCVRSFIWVKYFRQDKSFINRLSRSAINNFDLPELTGVQEFVNKVFSAIIYKESTLAIQKFDYQTSNQNGIVELPFNQLQNLELLFFSSLSKGLYLNRLEIKDIKLDNNNYFAPEFVHLHFHEIKPFRKTVSLIIKTCPQDYETIYINVKHIVKQLSSPNIFLEKIIAIDTKEKKYTREFTDKGTLETLMQQVKRLIEEQVVDHYITLPAEEVVNVNKRWFDIAINETHSAKGAPTAPQLYAFEQATGEYILQMDSDVLIARKDLSHSFLEDMVSEMEKNQKVVSVGFNVCQSVDYKPYFGFESGGFVPEVRMGLFHKERFLLLRPLPNSLTQSGKLQKSWHRAMEQKQKETGLCSIRGGDSRSFFVHPQNYRKTNADVWTTILDRVASGYIPECQKNEFDCAGSYYDWTSPKRNEELVIVCLVRNVAYERFLKMFCSVVSQTFTDWGMIIIDDASDNGLPIFIDNIIRGYSNKITFIKNQIRQGGMANTYKAIHYFASNPETVIMTIDGDDAIIGKTTFEKIIKKYRNDNADVVIGGMYQTYRLQAYYRYPANFVNPRNNGGNVWQHIRTFKKYLFDSLDISDLKITNTNQSAITKALSNQWLPGCADFAMMVPIIELSKNPMQLDGFCYYHEREVTNPERKTIKEQCVADILNKKSKNASCVFKGRKSFLPNLNKIEIDITYDCNLKCIACNRSCAQAPSKERLEFSDIQNFVAESIESGKKWELINILGGEPTLHPDFEKIVKYISEKYIVLHSPNTVLQVVSNGLTAETRNILNRIKSVKNLFIDYNSFKTDNKIEYFSPFNDAPIDDENFKNADYTKACWVTSYCGIGLNKFGYYGCASAAGIDRIINKDRGGIKHLKVIDMEKLHEQFLKFCPLCGNFKDYDVNYGNFIPRCEKAPLKENIVSKSWIELYNLYNQKK
jgi:glycosyltransferase involved in cell wall biosynthesis